MTNPTIINSKKQIEFTEFFILALKELNNNARIVQIAQKLDEYISHNLIQFHGELCYEWQYQMRWVKTQLQKQDVIKKERKGQCVYWSIISKGGN